MFKFCHIKYAKLQIENMFLADIKFLAGGITESTSDTNVAPGTRTANYLAVHQ